MFWPSGASKKARTSAPECANTAGATRYVEPFAQSRAIRMPSSFGAIERRKSSMAPKLDGMRIALDCAIKSDPHAIQLRGHREKEVLVLPHQATCIADQADPALGRTRKHVLIGHPALDLFLRYVGELLRAVVEELDAVVRRRVMRRADDRPRDELTSFGEVREAGGRDVADKPHLHADRAQTRGERAFEHPPASSSVPADDDRVAAAPEDVPRRATEPERELRREVEIRHTANAIGTEQPGH